MTRWTMTFGLWVGLSACRTAAVQPEPHAAVAPAPPSATRLALREGEAQDPVAVDTALTQHTEISEGALHVRMTVTPISGTLVSTLVKTDAGAGVREKLLKEKTCFDVFLSARSENNERVTEGQYESWTFTADLGAPGAPSSLELTPVSSGARHPEAATLREQLNTVLKTGHKDRLRDTSGPGRFLREFLCGGPALDVSQLRAFHATLKARPAVKIDFAWAP